MHDPTGHVYVAHTANDAVDVIDIGAQRYVRSIPDLPAVAGALIAEPDLVFTSNRGENTVGLFTTADVSRVDKIAVGVRPNGLAYDPRRARLLVAMSGPGHCDTSPCRSSMARKSVSRCQVPGARVAIYIRQRGVPCQYRRYTADLS